MSHNGSDFIAANNLGRTEHQQSLSRRSPSARPPPASSGVDAEGGRAIAYRSCDERNEGNNERKRRERQGTRSKAREKSANRGDN